MRVMSTLYSRWTDTSSSEAFIKSAYKTRQDKTRQELEHLAPEFMRNCFDTAVAPDIHSDQLRRAIYQFKI
jgi:hypothetical protein